MIKLSESRIKVKIIKREEWGKFYGIDKPTISKILHDVPDDVLISQIIVKKSFIEITFCDPNEEKIINQAKSIRYTDVK